MLRFRSLTAAIGFSLLTGTAFGAPILRGDITVVSPIVTVGDMFEDAGALAETAIFGAPAPGTTGTVDLNAIRAAAARIGITSFAANGLNAVRVSRAAAVVDETLIKDMIVADLTARGILTAGMHANIMMSQLIDPIQVSTQGEAARLDTLRYHPSRSDFTARFLLAGASKPLDISGSIAITIDAPHLAANLVAGTVLMPDHIVMRPIPLRDADSLGIVPLDQLVGKALRRQSRDGMVLRAADLTEPLAVSKNDLVTIVYRQGPMTLTVKGQAVTSAAKGAPLQVINLMSKRIISATAIAPGTVQVTAAPLALAGL